MVSRKVVDERAELVIKKKIKEYLAIYWWSYDE